MYQRPLSIAILALGGFAAASDALALGFGRIPESIAFGRALDLSVPLRIEGGESPSPGCLQAEVHVGEQRLPPGAVRLTLERHGEAAGDLRVRIRSTIVVQEPLVAVNLSTGCRGSVSRQFVVFADPQDIRAESSHGAVADLQPAAATRGAPEPAGRPPALRARAPAVAPSNADAVPSGGARPSARRTARKAQGDGSRERSQTQGRTPALAARSEMPKRRVEASAPRLKLEEPEELLMAATAAVAAQDAALASAAQAASAAEATVSAAEQRLVKLETNLKTMHEEAAAHRALMDQMRSRLAQAEDQGRMQWMLAAVVAALGALALWLGWRVRALQRERQAAWGQAAAAANGAAAMRPEATADPEAVRPLPRVDAAAAAASTAQHGAAVLPSALRVEDELTRPVSVDELIDLEQQAEFFVVLGEEDAVVDLLMSHLRSTGGTSPLPYLKLLEIYRRRGDLEAYERMRKRFSQRFNAVAPDWDADPAKGSDLQDYPVVLAALQACWRAPLDAMAALENLLFRKRSGELFELPAYRDVLTLYSVARDLHRQADRPEADVDVLLPLAAGDKLGLAAPPSIFDSLEPARAGAEAEDRHTAPVDLDLSEPRALHDSRVGEWSPIRVTLRQDC